MSTLKDIGREAHEINASNGWDVFSAADWHQNRTDEERLTDWMFEEPHLCTHVESCMGDPAPDYWRQWATSRLNPSWVVLGRGDTKEQAMAECRLAALKELDVRKLCTHMALIHSEVSEALEAVRHRDRPNFDEELADTVIRVLSVAYGLGTDLDAVVAEKLAKNRTRGLHHGGKAV